MEKVLRFALRRPITVMIGMTALVLGCIFALARTRMDVFPDLNQPVIYVAQPYGGMDPAQMEGLITNYYEYAFLFMNGIDHVESKNVQNIALVKLYFHSGTNMAQAVAEAAIYANRAKAFFPPGTVTPFIMSLDASMVPVAYVTLSSDTRSVDELADLMLFRVRPKLASLPGTTAPQPFGGSLRSIIVNLNPERLRAYDLSPEKVAEALASGNIITPSGNARIRDQMPIVSVNSIVVDPHNLGSIPIKPDVYLRDLGPTQDATDIPTGWALVNGRRAVYMPILKTADASTLTVATQLKENMDDMRSVLPKDCKLQMEFDQSPYVTGAVGSVEQQSAIGAFLTGLMVLLFLRDWRSDRRRADDPDRTHGRVDRPVHYRTDHQPHDPGRPFLGYRHHRRDRHRGHRKHPFSAGEGAIGAAGRACRHRRDHGAHLAVHSLHSRRVLAFILDGRSGAQSVCAAVHFGGVRHDHRVHPVDHLRAGCLDLDHESPHAKRGGCTAKPILFRCFPAALRQGSAHDAARPLAGLGWVCRRHGAGTICVRHPGGT